MEYIKKQSIYSRKIDNNELIINNDGTIELTPQAGAVKVAGNLEVTGSSSGPTNDLVYYVSLEGDDANDGLGAGASRAKRTIKSAVDDAPAGATIKVAPGEFYEDNPITLKERMTVRGDSLRNVLVFPNNPTLDLFLMDNACYLFQMTFRGLRDPGWCARIREGALVTTSPYVQNCTNMNGPWLNDGTEFIPFQTVQIDGVPATARPIENDPAVPLAKRINVNGGGNGILVDGNDYDQRSLVFSFVADAFTQIAQGGIGFHVTNFGYTQIVSCFSVFTRIGFLTTKGGYLSISNSVSDFGTFAIIADGLFDKVYTTARPSQTYTSNVGSVTVNSTGAGYTGTPTVTFEAPTTPGGVTAEGTASVDTLRGEVTSITVDNPGSGYQSAPTITLTGGGFSSAATATANLIKNKTIEVNSLRDVPQTGSVIKFEGDSTVYYVTGNNITTQPFIYDENVCRRDVRRIIDAIMGDVALGTNYQSISAGRSYLRANSAKVLNQQLAPTIFGIEATRDEILALIPDSDPANEQYRYDIIEKTAIITNFISNEDSSGAPDVFYDDTNASSPAAVAAKDSILLNKDFIVNETIKYIAEQFSNLSYDQDKCERDVRIITEAVAYDTALGTNYNSVTAGLAYARANASEVTSTQLEVTLAAYKNVKTLTLALSNVVADATATSRVGAAWDEVIEIIEGRGYNSTTCRRDVGQIVDSVAFDIALGTNYNAVTTGLSYQRANTAYVLSAQFQQTIASYQYMKTLATGTYLSDSTAETRSDAAFDEILDIIQNGVVSTDTAADALTFSDPGVDSSRAAARVLLQLNRDFIAGELITWINTNYPSLVYDQAKCSRDTKYIVDALSFDIQYTGNFATRRVATSYYEGTASQLPESQRVATAAAYAHLKNNIVSQVIIENYPGQNTNGTPASSDEVSDIESLTSIIEDVTRNDRSVNLPALANKISSLVGGGNGIYETFLDSNAPGTSRKYGDIDNNGSIASADATAITIYNAGNYDQLTYTQYEWIRETLLPAIEKLDRTTYSDFFYTTYDFLPTLVEPDIGWADAAIQTDVNTWKNAKTTIQDTVIKQITIGNISNADTITYPEPTNVITARANAKDQLRANRQFIIDEISAYVTSNNPSLTYDDDKCRRDVGYIVDALTYDILYEGNSATRQSADSYFVGTVGQLGTVTEETTATIAAYTHLQGVVTGILLEAALSKSTGNTTTQDTTNEPATATEVAKASELIQIIIDVLTAGSTTGLPTTSRAVTDWAAAPLQTAFSSIFGQQDNFADLTTTYILTNYPDFTYDRAKCKRDVGIILDAVVRDAKLNTNHNAIVAGQAYLRGNAATVKDSQFPATILALREAKRLSLTYVTASAAAVTRITDGWDTVLTFLEFGTLPSEGQTYPAPTPASQELIDAARQLQDNKSFLEEEVISYINDQYFVYDSAKCARDTQLILDAVVNDLLLGTNYNSITAGLSYYRAVSAYVISDQITQTIAAITHLKSEVATLLTGDATSISATNASFDEIIDIIQNGTANADALTFPNPTGNVLQGNAKDQLVANRDFIATELISWINANLPNLTYDEAKCQRDTKFIVDALCHDIMYETNLASIINAKAYFEASASVLPYDQRDGTADALQQLSAIVKQIVLGTYSGQNTSSGDASNIEAYRVKELTEIVVDVVRANTLTILPTETTPNLSGASAQTQASAALITATGDSTSADLVQSVITYINTNQNGFSYNQTKCRRDVGYLIESTTHDLLYTGNVSSLTSARSYFLDSESQVYGQETQTADALTRLKTVASQCIQGIAVTPTAGNTETQSLVGPYGTSTQSTTSNTLFNITIDAIQAGNLLSTPNDLEPDTSWASIAMTTELDKLILAKATVQTGTITFINDNILGFKYNVAACERDTKYIIDAALYDMMYGGNKQTRRAGEAYYTGTILNGITTTGDNADQEGVTEFTYKRLADVMDKIGRNVTVSTSDGVTVAQVYNATAGTSDATVSITANVTKIAEVISQGIYPVLPNEIDHDYAANAETSANAKRELVLDATQAIEDEAIRLLNLQYGGVAELDLFPQLAFVQEGTVGSMQNVSTVSTSGHAFEYVGAGITYNALPFFGGSAIAENEITETDNGRVFAGGTVDQIGNFRVGNFFGVNALTGAITLNAEEISLSGIASIGPFKRFGIPVGVELKEVSNSSDLRASTGQPDQNTTPTQVAVVNYVENRYLNKLTGGLVLGDVQINADLAVNGGDLTTTSTTFNLFDDNANIVNAFGGTTQLTIGAVGIGTTSIKHNVDIDLDLNVDGGDITTNVTDTFNLLNANARTINAFGDATTINMGAVSTDSVLTFNSEIIIFNSVGTLQLPVGTTAERGADSTAAQGQVRYNTTDSAFEGYDGANWGTLGGVRDVDQDTFIRPESSPGADEDTLEFFTDGIERMTLNPTTLRVDNTILTVFENTTESIDWETGAIRILGGVGIARNLHVQGYISGDSNDILQLTEKATDEIYIPANTIRTRDSFKIIANESDSATDNVIDPITLAHHNESGNAVIGAGIGLPFEQEITNNNYVTAGRIDVVSTDVTTGDEDFDMLFTTRIAGASVEKLRLSETTSTFTTNVQIDQDLFVTGILDAAGFRGSIFADDSTEMLDAVNNRIIVTNLDAGTLTLINDLEVQYGGTGASTFTTDGILYGNAANPVQVTAAAGDADITESFQILSATSDADSTPVWTDTIDGGSF